MEAISSLLELEEFEVVEAVRDRGRNLRRLTLVPKAMAGICPHCSGVSDQRHVCHDRAVTDLPMAGCRMELVVRLWQFRCEACDKFFTPRFAALAEGAHATERFLERLAELGGHGDVSTAARFFGIPEKTAEDWYYRHLERKQNQSQSGAGLQPVRSLASAVSSAERESTSCL